MKLHKVLVLSLLAFCLVASSCGKKDGEKKKDYRPYASGELAEIVVIYHKQGSTEAFKEKVRQLLGQKIKGLPDPSEDRFKLMFTDETFLKGYFKLHHNIFVLLHEDNLDQLTKTFGANNKASIQEIINKKEALGFQKEDVWARNQNVFYVTAKNEAELLKKMEERASGLIEIANTNEAKSGKSKVFNRSLVKDTFYQRCLNEKGYAIRKPESYRLALETAHFSWLRKESSKYDYGLFIYDVPYTSENQFQLDEIIKIRDSFGQRYVPGELEGSYMSISPVIPTYLEEINFKDRYAVSLKGWWRVKGDYMAGPFVCYVVYDEERQRLVFAEGNVYGPNRKKAKPLREVELIINSLRIK